MAGDLVYSLDNIVGPDPASPQYTPIGLAQCSQVNLILATDAIMKLVGGETRRVIPCTRTRCRRFTRTASLGTASRSSNSCWPRAGEPRGVSPHSLHP
jgi:hypothetical protein